MPAFAALLVWVIAAIAIVLYVAWLAARYYYAERVPDEIHFAQTQDGWRIAVCRYRAAQPGPRSAEPVILCHGLGTNRRCFDLTDRHSLAGSLARNGHDVWIVDFRGRGFSTRPRLFSRFRWDFCFDEYVEQDLPAVVELVRQRSGASHAAFVGFDTGGLAVLAALTRPLPLKPRAVVALGSTAHFKRQREYLSGSLIRHARFIRHAILLRAITPLVGRWRVAPFHILHNPDNMEGRTLRLALINVVVNFSRNELLQVSDWLLYDAFRTIDRRRDYRAELHRVTAPVLLVAGSRDIIAPPDMVKETLQALGSQDTKLVLCSRGGGFKANYGHLDLLLGRHAPEEVYPLVAEWLNAHQGPREEGSQVSSEGVPSPSGSGETLLSDASSVENLAGDEHRDA